AVAGGVVGRESQPSQGVSGPQAETGKTSAVALDVKVLSDLTPPTANGKQGANVEEELTPVTVTGRDTAMGAEFEVTPVLSSVSSSLEKAHVVLHRTPLGSGHSKAFHGRKPPAAKTITWDMFLAHYAVVDEAHAEKGG
ncbi:unnamed protein product, partial [Discosporangium mesarthrocarpum]